MPASTEPRGWIVLSAGEGCTRTAARSIQKLLGDFGKTAPYNILATLISLGMVNMIIGFVGAKREGRSIIAPLNQVLASAAIGTISVFMSFLSLRAFVYDGSDMGVVTFLVALSVIPGAVLDRIFFRRDPRTHLSSRQLLGLLTYVFAGWSVLNFPSVQKLLHLPIWALVALAIAFLFAVNEILKRKIGTSTIHPSVMNFWIGLVTMVLCAIWLTFIDGWETIHKLPLLFLVWSVVLGIFTFFSLALGMLSYKPWAGGTVARKKVAMWGVYLSISMIAGYVLYGEILTIGKGIGVLGFLLAFILMNRRI